MNTNNQDSGYGDPFNTDSEELFAAPDTPVPAQESNIYSSSHQQRQEPSLDSGAPELTDPKSRGINKKMIVMVALMGGLALLLTVLVINHLFGGKKGDMHAQREERLEPPPLPPPSVSTSTSATVVSAQSPPQADAIDLVPNSNRGNPNQARVHEEVVEVKPPPPDPLLERRRQATPLVDGGATTAPAPDGGAIEKGSVVVLANRDYMLVRGTYIRCVLETRIVTDVPGFTSCVTTEPVYSVNGRKLLLPQGSKVSGQLNASSPTGPRISVIWDRVLTPTGYDVRLRSPGVDEQGGGGHEGDYRSHWPSRIGSAILISMMSDLFKYGAAEYGPTTTVTTNTSTSTSPFESETAQTMQDIAKEQIKRLSARPATVTINQGSIINIYTARDIDFSSVIRD